MKVIVLSVLFFVLGSSYALQSGQPAPNFKLPGSHGEVELSKLKGKYVLLEWYNDGCPFVRKHYDVSNMQALQKKYKDQVVWLSINSSAPGKQGYLADASVALKKYNEEKMASQNLLLDPNGKVGRAYGAKTTPHMYLIDPKGKLIYQGAIDSIPSSDSDDIKHAKNYVTFAMNDIAKGKEVRVQKTRPYGCSVKY